ncbi:MAG: 30S ribosomal protein S16 [Microgenomates group bacterium Gr01-1014_93]|nr:MAG: 30S ribosomal protein S16 [Microgenomates group bacterium Gr01-1014_93]
MLKIRLMRIGAKKRPFYRVVVVDERAKRTGGYIELLGTYNPITHPHEINLRQERIDEWIKKGAQMSDGFLRIIGKAPQHPPRKPKKVKQEKEPKESKVTEEKTETEETVKSSESEAVGEVESTSEEGTTKESDSQQTHSEAQEKPSEPEISEPSGASATDEPAPEVEKITTEPEAPRNDESEK